MSNVLRAAFPAVIALVAFVSGCGGRPPVPNRAAPIGSMDRYIYQCWEGGPHIVLPDSLRGDWHGERMGNDPLDPSCDYGRACKVERHFGLIDVGRGKALVFTDPPMVAWDPQSTGDVQDFFVLLAWEQKSLDDLLDRTKARATLKETGQRWLIEGRGAGLLYAGDDAGGSVVGRVDIPLAPGAYRILTAEFDELGAGHVVRVHLRREPDESRPIDPEPSPH